MKLLPDGPAAQSTVKTCIALAIATIASTAWPSSHREAPFMAMNPSVDATDLYMFRSYEAGRGAFVTILANYNPFQDPQGGPNFYMFNPNALYEIHIDNTGSGSEAMTFQFRFTNTSKGATINVGGKAVKIPLIAGGTLSGSNPAALNVNETYTVKLVRGDRRLGAVSNVTAASGGAGVFTKPVDNIGDKTFGVGGYATYANQFIYDVAIPGCSTNGRVFVGQRKEPFNIAVGKTFDLFNLNPLGAEVGGNNNDLEGKSVSTLALEVPIACLTAGADPVIGAWTTASLRQGSLLSNATKTGLNKTAIVGGAWTQVSRLGNPLVNEVVIGLDDKDKFNSAKPKNDATNFADYVTNPVLPAVIQSLFPAAVAPTNFPRTDLLTVFLKGIKGVNQPLVAGVPAEMMRLDTSKAAVAVGAQNPLGVAGGDNAGYPNGRRPGDDVVDLSLRVAMGALCVLTGPTDTLEVGCAPGDAPAGGLALTDGVRKTSVNYGATFPYLTTPISGNFNPPADAGTTFP